MPHTLAQRCAVLSLPAMTGLLSACHHEVQPAQTTPPVHSSVSYQAVPDKSLGHYELSSEQGVVGAEMAAHNPGPIYPADMVVAERKGVDIQALLIVGRDGHVHEVRIAGGESDGAKAPFALAVAAATLNWQFTPLRITTWKDLPDGSSTRVDGATKPFSQRYRFHFTIVDGKPKVTTGSPNKASQGAAERSEAHRTAVLDFPWCASLRSAAPYN